MPGPLLTVTIGETARHGIVAAPLIILGHIALELILVVALALGMVNVLKTGASQWMAVFGGLFMLWMGWGMIRGVIAGRVSLPPHKDTSRRSSRNNRCSIARTTGSSNPGWFYRRPYKPGQPLLASMVGHGGTELYHSCTEIRNCWSCFLFTGHALSDLVWYFMIGQLFPAGGSILLKLFIRWSLLCVDSFVRDGGYFIHYGVSYIM